VVEHHANLLPWGRVAHRRYVECGPDGTFGLDDVISGLERRPRPALLAVTGASNVTGWLPPITDIVHAAHDRGVPVALDAAQLAPHRAIPAEADFVAFSGHKMYAPFGAGALIGPREVFAHGEPFLAGGGAVDLVDLDEVWWTDPPDREEAGSPNVVGAVALDAAISTLEGIGWPVISEHEMELARRLYGGLASIEGVRVLGPQPGTGSETLAVVSFVVEGAHHAFVAARLSAEWGIGVRHGCFCAHPYLIRLLGLSPEAVSSYRDQVRRGDHRFMPGAVRASCALSTTRSDIDGLVAAVATVAHDAQSGSELPVLYEQEPTTGDFWPVTGHPSWARGATTPGSACARG
jgi:selenocysteine lyase/cysteine desulfurase